MTVTSLNRAYPATSAAHDTGLLIGRCLLVAMFIFSGAGKLMDIPGTAQNIASVGLPAPSVLAVAAGLAEVIGGLMIVIGWQTRLAALGLLIYTLIATYFFHAFWAMPAGPDQMGQMIHAMKNLSIVGAFVMLAAVGAGRYAVDGRRSTL